jgi:hypothetical protein
VSVAVEQLSFFPADHYDRGWQLRSRDTSEFAHPLGVALAATLTIACWAFIAWMLSILI